MFLCGYDVFVSIVSLFLDWLWCFCVGRFWLISVWDHWIGFLASGSIRLAIEWIFSMIFFQNRNSPTPYYIWLHKESGLDATEYASEMQWIAGYLVVSNVNMQEGARWVVNISIQQFCKPSLTPRSTSFFLSLSFVYSEFYLWRDMISSSFFHCTIFGWWFDVSQVKIIRASRPDPDNHSSITRAKPARSWEEETQVAS